MLLLVNGALAVGWPYLEMEFASSAHDSGQDKPEYDYCYQRWFVCRSPVLPTIKSQVTGLVARRYQILSFPCRRSQTTTLRTPRLRTARRNLRGFVPELKFSLKL